MFYMISDAREGDLSNSVKNGILYLEDPIDQVGYYKSLVDYNILDLSILKVLIEAIMMGCSFEK